MDQITISSLIFVSFPESIAIILFGIIAIGKINQLLSGRVRSLVKIFIFSLIYLIACFFIRRLVENVIENFIISFIIFCLLYILLLGFKFYESIIASIFGFLFMVIIQIVALSTTMAITGLTLSDAYQSDLTRFLLNLPERIIEIILIYLSIRFNLKVIDLNTLNIKKREYYIQLFVYFISIGTLIFIAVLMSDIIFFKSSSINTSSFTFERFNIYLTLFVTIILSIAIRNISEYYKTKNNLNNNELVQSLQFISSLICEQKYTVAHDELKRLINHISEQKEG
ncbi:MAG: hypothetical protein N2489_09580 [Clostridia bacterium]|nr:hypothetical protein [Clostridia bacterium]